MTPGNLPNLILEAPLCPPPARGKIRAGYLHGFSNLIRQRGEDPGRILDDHGIDPAAFAEPYRNVEGTSAVNMLEYCSYLLDDPLFGLHLADRQTPSVLGAAMALARAAPTLRTGLQALERYLPLTNAPGSEIEVVAGRTAAEFRWRWPTSDSAEQGNLHAMQLSMKALRQMGQPFFQPSRATLTFALPGKNSGSLEDRLGCRIQSRSSHNAIVFSADLLDCPLETADEILFGLLGSYLTRVSTGVKPRFIEQMEGCVRSTLTTGSCTVEYCARQLGLSVRTLQKRLMRAGTTFSDIVQSQRIQLAKQALLMDEKKLDQIAYELGYADQTGFGRAFKRATGLSPHAYRLRKDIRRIK